MYRIVYFDDTPYWRDLYKETFANAGFEIKTLPDARGDIIKEVLDFQPDLILLDIWMPEITGFDAIKILKDDERTKKFPVFFFSSMGDPRSIQKGIELGAEKYLVKPDYEPEEIVKIIKDYAQSK